MFQADIEQGLAEILLSDHLSVFVKLKSYSINT